jgi:hypothetical protein
MSVADMFDDDRIDMGNFSQRTYQGCFLSSFGSFGQAVSEEKICIEINQSEKKLPVTDMCFNG